MGMQSSAYLHVRPFSNEAAQRVKEIDLSEYNLDDLGDGWQETEDGLFYWRQASVTLFRGGSCQGGGWRFSGRERQVIPPTLRSRKILPGLDSVAK